MSRPVVSRPEGSRRTVPAAGRPAARRAGRSRRAARRRRAARSLRTALPVTAPAAAPVGGPAGGPPDGPCGGPPAGAGAAGRGPGRAPEVLRRLLPRALVLALLAGGTSAFVAHDKEIALSVDGTSRTLHTFAGDVGTLLDQEGVAAGKHDIVAPSQRAALADGDRIVVRHGRPVTLTLDGRPRRVWTTAGTVDGALEQLGVRAQGAQLSASRSARIGRSGIALDVLTERRLTVRADGRDRAVRTNAGTVREVLEESGVRLGEQDTVSPPLDAFPREGRTLTVTRVADTEEVRRERIGFARVRRDDAGLRKGTEVVEQQGRPGVRRVTYRVRTVDGEVRERRRVGEEVLREPRRQIVRVGTRPRPRPTEEPPKPEPKPEPEKQPEKQQERKPAKQPEKRPEGQQGGSDRPDTSSDGLNWSALARCESGGRPDAVDPSGTYGGLYQFDTRTWRSVGGTGKPQDAPAAEQTLRAKRLYDRRGASPWPVCGRKLTQ